MPRSSNGTFTFSSVLRAVAGAVLDPAKHNSTLDDIEQGLTESLPRDGRAGMSGQLKLADGLVTAPGLAFGTQLGTGLYKTSGGFAVAIAGVKVAEFGAGGLSVGVPIGASIPYSGVALPTGWAWEDGSNFLRSGNPALLTALTFNATATITSGQATITSLSADPRFLGLEGAAIEGVGIPPGTTVSSVTVDSAAMSAQATVNGTAVPIRIFPFGNGNGTTTAALPDSRGRVSVGRDNMGGTAANRLTASGTGNPALDGTRLGAAGGVDRFALLLAQMAQHNHGGQTTGGSATLIAPEAAYGNYTFSSAAPQFNLFVATANGSTVVTNQGRTHGIANAGGNEAHPNVQPSIVRNYIIFTGSS